MRFDNSELLGVFGFSWQEKLSTNIGFPVTFLNASYYGNIVNAMNKVYKKYKTLPDSEIVNLVSLQANQTPEIAAKFLDEIRRREGNPTIPYTVKGAESRKTTDIIGALTGTSTSKIALILALSIGAWLLVSGKIKIPEISRGE